MSMQLQKSKNVKRNVIYGIVNKIVLVVGPFCIKTAIVYKMGEEYVGVTSVFSSILQMLNLTELGFSSAIIFCLYEPIAKEQLERVGSLLYYLKKIYCMIGVIVFGVGCLMLPFLNYFVSKNEAIDINYYLLYVLYLLNSVAGYFGGSYRECLLRAIQRVDIISNIRSLCSIIGYVLQFVCIVVLENYYLYALCFVLQTVIENICIYKKSEKIYHVIRPKTDISPEDRRKLYKQVKGIALSRICKTSRNGLDSIFISFYFGLVLAAQYSFYYYIYASCLAIVSIMFRSVEAAIGNEVINKSKTENFNRMKLYSDITSYMFGIVAVCMLFLYQDVIELWVGANNKLSSNVALVFALYFYISSIGVVNSIYIDCCGLWDKCKVKSIVETVMNVVLDAILGKIMGVTGIVLATIITMVYGFFAGGVVLFREYLGKNRIEEYTSLQCKNFIIVCVIAVVIYEELDLVGSLLSTNIFFHIMLVVASVFILFFGAIRANTNYNEIKNIILKVIRA